MGQSFLHQAAEKEGGAEACRALLGHPESTATDAKDLGRKTALHAAAYSGNPDTCSALLCHPKFMAADAKDRRGGTALHCAAISDLEACAKMATERRWIIHAQTSVQTSAPTSVRTSCHAPARLLSCT